MSQSYNKKHIKDESKVFNLPQWRGFWKIILDQSIKYNLGVGAFDLSNKDEMAGIVLADDLNLKEIFP